MNDKIEIDQLFAECVGTYVFFMCILQTTDPFPIAIGLLAAVYMFGKVSGGFFNSTLSFIMYLKGNIGLTKLFAYIFAQTIGGILALATWRIINNV
jgi:glycerol uptake facilitator-like aquaporin